MPGKKDWVSMKVGGVKEKVQKRQILCTVYEAFLLFKEENPTIKIGFSKFAEERPKNVVLPGSTGTHTVCVCSYHQNPKLMMANSRITSRQEFKKIVGEVDGDLFHGDLEYHHLIAQLMCQPPSVACWQGECEQCGKSDGLADKLVKIFGELDIDMITYKQWESTDRTELVTITDSASEFVQKLIQKLEVLKTHQFINNQQTKFFYSVKETLPVGTALVVGDFSENYSFVYQDAVQGVHWSNSSCTLHPWMCYFRDKDDKIKSLALLFISDCLVHETVAVYAFQRKLIEILKDKLTAEGFSLEVIQYFTDGCAKQYKNKKNFLNMTYHFEDFGVVANWAFSATSHGKGPWDGIAGCAKREAALESLRRPEENQIQTAQDFYNFVKAKFKKLVVEFIAAENIAELEEEILEERFKAARTIPGTQGFHNYESIPGNHRQVKVKKFSLSNREKIVSVVKRGAGTNIRLTVQPVGIEDEAQAGGEAVQSAESGNSRGRGQRKNRGNPKNT